MDCRACYSTTTPVLDLGTHAFTGIFPASPTTPVQRGRLALELCEVCGLVQLADTFPADVMYGEDYGYRSGLNASMVDHLTRTARRLEQMVDMHGATVLDIGSNDGTLLGAYTAPAHLIGIDPTSPAFAEFHPPGMLAVDRFFTADTFWDVSNRPARIVTSIAMFYDLPDPVAFAKDVYRVMEDDGIWHIEVAYAPWMLSSGAYDTICHEHLEYYSLRALSLILTEAGFKIIDASTNATNGGSLAVTVAKAGSLRFRPDLTFTPWLLAKERRAGAADVFRWLDFAEDVAATQADLVGLISALTVGGSTVMGLGASTKGNVVLQTSGIGTQLLPMIGEVNPVKFGRVTPGTHIPIVSERQVLDARPDYLLVLPWHFREGITRAMDGYLQSGGRLIFPLPDIEVVGA